MGNWVALEEVRLNQAIGLDKISIGVSAEETASPQMVFSETAVFIGIG